jgi:hypothetical protein
LRSGVSIIFNGVGLSFPYRATLAVNGCVGGSPVGLPKVSVATPVSLIEADVVTFVGTDDLLIS